MRSQHGYFASARPSCPLRWLLYWSASHGTRDRVRSPAPPLPPPYHWLFPSFSDIITAFNSVVAVHGLNFKGDPDHAWKTWSRGDKLWLRDFLPARLPRPARVMLFAYNSSPVLDASAAKLDEHAESLLHWLSLRRKVGSSKHMAPSSGANNHDHILTSPQDCQQRPLIFVGHSLGGLVIKQVRYPSDAPGSLRRIHVAKLGACAGNPGPNPQLNFAINMSTRLLRDSTPRRKSCTAGRCGGKNRASLLTGAPERSDQRVTAQVERGDETLRPVEASCGPGLFRQLLRGRTLRKDGNCELIR